MKLRNRITKEICDAEVREDGIYLKANWSDEENWFCYDLETLARGWEYYVEPKEPLIKDEKIRKAVRAWAELIPSAQVRYDHSDGRFYTHSDYIVPYSISFPVILGLDETKFYTIAELCGDEEE